jgi:AdoMet-dependent heme synthase
MRVPSRALEQIRRNAAARRIPLHAQLELTHRCNLRCQHCYLSDVPSPGAELSLREWQNVLRQLAELQTLFLSFTGGEPLLREDLFEILAAARRGGFVFSLLTNGTRIDREAARRIAEHMPFQVHVSVLGPEEEHDRLTGELGSHRRALEAMDALRECGVSVTGKLILTHATAPRAAACRRRVLDHADDCVLSVDLAPTLAGQSPAEGLALTPEDLASLPRSGRAPAPVQDFPEQRVCSAGASLLAVSPTGEVLPCIMFRKSVGSIRESPLRALWNSPEMVRISELRHRDLQACEGCADRGFCRFCPGRAWLMAGDMTTPEPSLCRRAAAFRAVSECPRE